MIRIRLLGSVSIAADGTSPSGRATQRRRLALLALLAASRGKGVSRDKILAYLWPERTNEQARHSLSQALYAIRQELGESVVLTGIDELRLNDAAVATDLDAFETFVEKGDPARAIATYGGAFLDGFHISDAPEFEEWADEQRTRLAGAYGRALEEVASAATQRGAFGEAADLWRRRVTLDPLNSRLAVKYMHALAEAGDRAGAIGYAGAHTALLRNELDVHADPAVKALADELRAAPAQTPAVQIDAGATPNDSAPLPTVPIAEHPTGRRWALRERRTIFTGALVLAAAIAVVLVSQRGFDRGHASPPRTVLLGAISGDDGTLGSAVREALRAELEMAEEISVTGDAAARETLRLMRLAADTPLLPNIALDVARRRGVPLVITGSTSAVGSGAQIVARLLDARTGERIAVFTERPTSDDEILPAVTNLARALRRSVSGIDAESAAVANPLPAVTTASLPALRNYVLARQALARLDRQTAIQLGEVALIHDSAFALAHYLLGDVLWYVDQQRHSDQHMQRALDLSANLPPRERLIVQARYQQLVLDRPDSALVYWKLLEKGFPEEPLAYEGMRWVYRALGERQLMVAAAESAFRRDETAFPAFVEARLITLMDAGDTAGAHAFARSVAPRMPDAARAARIGQAFANDDPLAALSLIDAANTYQRHVALLAMGDIDAGRRELKAVRRTAKGQFLPRALLLQARAELGPFGSMEQARSLGRESLTWLQSADLSPPAYGRLAERIADVAARSGDVPTLMAVRDLLLEKDSGRGMRSYERSLSTVRACVAFARGEWRTAAELAAAARPGMFYGRSVATVALLEADARVNAGQRSVADSLYREVISPNGFIDGDDETHAILRWFAKRRVTSDRTQRGS